MSNSDYWNVIATRRAAASPGRYTCNDNKSNFLRVIERFVLCAMSLLFFSKIMKHDHLLYMFLIASNIKLMSLKYVVNPQVE